jgi:hypothetical protein
VHCETTLLATSVRPASPHPVNDRNDLPEPYFVWMRSRRTCEGTGPSHYGLHTAPPPPPGGGTNPPTTPTGIAVKRNDYNREGISDIVAVKDDYLHIWFGTGSGGFLYGGAIGSGWTPYAATLTAFGDINRDGNGDLVALCNDYIYTWFGSGSCGFATGGLIGSGWNVYAPIH